MSSRVQESFASIGLSLALKLHRRPSARLCCKSLRRPGETLSYHFDAHGNCRYTFRHSDRDASAKGGGAGRAKGKKDKEGGQHIEPTIYVEKFDRETGEIIADPSAVGSWRAFMVTFPLREPVHEVEVAEVAYPIETSPYATYMSPEETQARDEGIAQKRVAAGA